MNDLANTWNFWYDIMLVVGRAIVVLLCLPVLLTMLTILGCIYPFRVFTEAFRVWREERETAKELKRAEEARERGEGYK